MLATTNNDQEWERKLSALRDEVDMLRAGLRKATFDVEKIRSKFGMSATTAREMHDRWSAEKRCNDDLSDQNRTLRTLYERMHSELDEANARLRKQGSELRTERDLHARADREIEELKKELETALNERVAAPIVVVANVRHVGTSTLSSPKGGALGDHGHLDAGTPELEELVRLTVGKGVSPPLPPRRSESPLFAMNTMSPAGGKRGPFLAVSPFRAAMTPPRAKKTRVGRRGGPGGSP